MLRIDFFLFFLSDQSKVVTIHNKLVLNLFPNLNWAVYPLGRILEMHYIKLSSSACPALCCTALYCIFLIFSAWPSLHCAALHGNEQLFTILH